MWTPGSIRRRRSLFRRECRWNSTSGGILAPEGVFPQRMRTRPLLRRHFFSEGPFSYGIPSGTGLLASLSRRRARFRSSSVRDLPSGVIFFAGGRPFAENAAGTHLPAPFSRQRARYRVCAPSLYSPARAVKRRSCARMTNPAGRTFATTLAASMSGEVTQVERPRTAACSAFLTTSAGFS